MENNKLLVLPIPELDKTFNKYNLWTESFRQKNNIEYNFQREKGFINNISGKLNDKLKIKYESVYPNSWLEDWWLEGYLSGREAVTIESNFSAKVNFGLESFSHEELLNRLIFSMVQVKNEYLLNGFNEKKNFYNKPLCRKQLEILKGASRVFNEEQDQYNIAKNSNYMTLFYGNNLYKINVQGNNKKNYDKILKEILNQNIEKKYSLGTISFDDRNGDISLQNKLREKNKKFFSTIENSIFNITIINQEFKNEDEKIKFNLLLNGENSYVYKPLNFIYNLHNKELFINVEHTYQDGLTILEILERTKYYLDNYIHYSGATEGSYNLIEENISQEEEIYLYSLKKKYLDKIGNIDFKKLLIPIGELKNRKYSKDAFIQMCIQYAVRKTYGEYKGTYEAVDMKEYKGGRTECIRPNSKEAMELVEAMLANKDIFLLKELYNKAENEHKTRIKECKKGYGLDRHFFGLKQFINELPETERELTVEFFNNPTLKKFTENFISTTSLGHNEVMGQPIFCPVVKEGIGISYEQNENNIEFNLSTYIDQIENLNIFMINLKEGFSILKEINL